MKATLAYLADGTPVCVPERRIAWLYEHQRAEPLRGNAHTLAVMQDSDCIGWITVEDVSIQKGAAHA